MRTVYRAAGLALICISVAFVVLPLLAIVMRTSPGMVSSEIGRPEVASALRVSIVTTLVAHLVVLIVGTPTAWVLARTQFVGRGLVIGILELPMVLPPAVAGIGLLAAFGRAGLLGDWLLARGITIPFTAAAVVLASIFVSAPFYLRQAVAAFEAVDEQLIEASRTLGRSPFRSCLSVAIPLAMPGLEAGSALALARGFGEFGATIMFAGSLPGTTQTLPLAVYALLDTDMDAALAASVLLIFIGGTVLIANKVVSSWTTSRLT